MSVNRRQFVGLGLSAAAAAALFPGIASANLVDEAIAGFTSGADLSGEGITLIAPEIAENGNTVPIEVSAPGAEAIFVLATGNPNPNVATFNFGPLSANQAASTRIRLAGEQDVVAIARMADGSFRRAVANVKVTIGGCGG